jgi:hypothetical protein
MVTMNQLYLVKGGPGIIALHSFLYLQPCRVTATSISLCLYMSHQFAAVLYVWYKSHQFAAVAVHWCLLLDRARISAATSMYLCLKTSPLTKRPLAALLPAVPICPPS